MILHTYSGDLEMERKIIIAVLLVIGIANATNVDVDIKEYLKCGIVSFSYNEKGNLVNFSSELFNTGSTAYTARARIDLIDNDNIIFSGWSHEKALMPGNRADFYIFWYSEESGNFTAQLRVYFGNELLLHDKINISINTSAQPDNMFNLSNFRTYEDKITFDVNTEEANAIVIPYHYPAGWIFEQSEISGSSKAAVNYIPAFWTDNKYMTVLVVSEDGKHYTKGTFKMEKETSMENIFKMIVFLMRLLLQY
jgi:uncharacterized protein YbdZ (MbtH family)